MNGVPGMVLNGLREFLDTGVVTSERMRAIERNAIALGVGTLQMMESAGAAIANAVRAKGPSKVLVLCGKGNNGADGMAAARYLQNDLETSVICIGGESRSDENRLQLRLLGSCAVSVHVVDCPEEVKALKHLFDSADLVVDALLGTGARGGLREPYRTCVGMANEAEAFILAVDVPTEGTRADAILALHRPKMEGVDTACIGIPLEAEIFTGPGDLLLIPERSADAHKGAGGRVLVVGGGPYQGAPYLTALAALRSGADLVRIASPVAMSFPDLIYEPLEGERIGEEHLETLLKLSSWADVVAIGAGMGPEGHGVAQKLASCCRRLVVDADALRTPLPVGEMTIYTPHAGEFGRMTGVLPPKDLRERARLVKRYARRNGVVVLKGPVDIVSDGERLRFNRSGCPAMTVGGTGDVLAGAVAAFFCRMPAFEAACAATYANGIAGERAALDRGDGMIASDLLSFIPAVLRGEKSA
ncbi:MAG: NAD(P)H-hydrate dehydratase [Methanomicrobiales archaeon]|nr:NAD(P)H-hydrate dehydratase [Methanomicrobiales archaeon]